MNLTSLLRPTSWEGFWSDFWQTKPLLLQRNDPHYYSRLFTLADLWRVLARGRFLAHEVLVVKNSQQTSGHVREDGTTNLAKIRAAVEDDQFTLKLMNPELRHPPLHKLCQDLESNFVTQTTVGLFLTPPGSVGVDVHFDIADVLVLQIEGRKIWRVYEPVVRLPSELEDRIPIEDKVGDPLFEVELEPGDFLYVPRGFPHEPFTRDSSSLHISIGIQPVVWSDLLQIVLRQARTRNDTLRQRLPQSWLRGNDSSQDSPQTPHALLTKVAETMDIADALRELRSEVLGSLHKKSMVPMKDGVGQSEITLATYMERTSTITPQLELNGTKATLTFQGGSLRGPAGLAPAFRHIIAYERFQVSDLGREITDQSKISLVRRLMREGLLRVDHQTA